MYFILSTSPSFSLYNSATEYYKYNTCKMTFINFGGVHIHSSLFCPGNKFIISKPCYIQLPSFETSVKICVK
jgi:hypothetical protein